ncbi:sperm mitochondrial-associated cysteine-rich protein isoform X1 [Aethina tumida]|uniref:sperm mitochondrial-associated cysteine-rich protein isoform X1 n=1 Tax=Aethina tumida TaxID=116153 RepID=UPI00096B2468|nr:sperm mitochondrial-associated cysteine-rich protein isoform X1 [Aethina tumida]
MSQIHLIYDHFLDIVQCSEQKLCCPDKPPEIVPMDKCTAARNRRPEPPEEPRFPPRPKPPSCANCEPVCFPDRPICCVEKLDYCNERSSCLPCVPLPPQPPKPPTCQKKQPKCDDGKAKKKGWW